MKRLLLLMLSYVLLLAGCTKEQMTPADLGEGVQTVTFTAAVADGVTTKAVTDGDGAADSVNRCIMEIYYGDELFTRMYAPVDSQKKSSFTLQLVSNRTYTVAFWADHVADAATEAGLTSDLYYNTASLKAVSVIDSDSFSYFGSQDSRDAFAFCGQYKVDQDGSTFNAVLRRPFAQINVITTDVATVRKVAALVPQQVNVTLKGASKSYNVLDSTAVAGQTGDLSYTADVYKWDATKSECTLSMDYIFAEKEKAVMDIDWAAVHGSDAEVVHTFASVPYQRNYRTNIKGALLTTTGKWTVNVDPSWIGEKNHPIVIASTLEEAQAAAGPASGTTEAAGTIIVKEEAVTNRDTAKDKTAQEVAASTPGVSLPDGSKAIEFVLTSNSKEDVIFELPALPDDNYYWYIRHEDDYPTKNLSVKVNSSDATKVIIDAPSGTHVELNDVEYTHVVALTGDNTLVIPAGITVKKLTVKKGGVEIHGTVESLEVIPESGTSVKFRECENLSADVYNAAKGYIDTPLYTAKSNGSKWDIVKSSCKIGEVGYASLEDAIASIPADNAETKTIDMMDDCIIGSCIIIGKKNVVFNGSSFSIKASDDNILGEWKTLVRLDGAENIVFNSITFDGNNKNIGLVGNGRNIKYSGCNFINAANAQYYGACSGTLVYENCNIITNVYAINQSESGATVTIDNCHIKGWNSFGSTETVSIKDCTFGKSGYGVLRFYADATISGCTFTDDFEFIDGGKTQDAHTIIINSCSDNAASKASLTDGPNTVFAIDATISQGRYMAGTYIARKETVENNLASGFILQDKGNNVYVVSKVDGVAKVGTAYYKTLEAAFEAVTPDTPMEWVDESVWAADKEAYFNGQAYSFLKDAIADANKADSSSIYIRPAYNGLTVLAHDLIETDITIFGNDANVNHSWEPSLEFSGNGPEGHNLTKDITFSIYNLHNGAGAWGARTTDHAVNVVMRNCKNVHEVMIQGGSSANAICNVSVTNCTFKAGSYLAEPCLVTGNGGNIVVDGCTFEGVKTNFGININNKKGGDVETVIKNCTVRDCGTEGKEPFRFCGEVSCKQSVTIDNVVFENTTSGVNDILFGKNTTGENNCEVSYTIKNTACSYKVLTVGTTTVKTNSETAVSDEVKGDNK